MFGRKAKRIEAQQKRIEALEAVVSGKLADFDPEAYRAGLAHIAAARSNADAKAQFEEMRRVHNEWLASRFGRARRFEE